MKSAYMSVILLLDVSCWAESFYMCASLSYYNAHNYFYCCGVTFRRYEDCTHDYHFCLLIVLPGSLQNAVEISKNAESTYSTVETTGLHN